MATGIIADTVLVNGLPANGAVVNAYKASRFGSVPNENAAPPGGGADSGPVTCGPSFGSEGSFQITVPTQEAYYVSATYNNFTSWQFYSDTLVSPGSGSLDSTNGDITVSAVGDSQNAGVNALGARADHKHGREAFAAPGTLAFGAGASAGSAASVSRSDHGHGMPADPTGKSLQLTGLTGTFRLVGVTTGGPPTTGTFQLNDVAFDGSSLWLCTTPGAAGTFVFTQISGGGVQSVTAGTNLTNSGTTTNPILNAAENDPLIPTGYYVQSSDRRSFSSATLTPLTSGQLSFWATEIIAGAAVSKIAFLSGTTAMVTGTHQWFVLYDLNGNALCATSDDGATAWAVNTLKPLTVDFSYSAGSWHGVQGTGAPFTTTYSGVYYVGCMVAAATVPSLIGNAANATAAALVPVIGGQDATTGLLDPKNATHGAPATFALTASALGGWPYFLIG